MKRNEKGFTIIELVIAFTIMVLASGAAGIAIFQIFKNTERNRNYMTAVNGVQNAGYWIGRDAQMAVGIITDNLTPPLLMTLNWIEDTSGENPIYHSANYTVSGLSDNIGTLVRSHSTSAGTDEQTLIAQYVYYNLADSDNTTQASFQNDLLTLRLTAVFNGHKETREYKIKSRTNTF